MKFVVTQQKQFNKLILLTSYFHYTNERENIILTPRDIIIT